MPAHSMQVDRQRNEERILSVLREAPGLSRREIAERAGVSYPTAAKIVAGLVSAKLVDERDRPYSGFGRPGKVYRLATETRQVAGLVIGTRRCELVLAGCDGRIRLESCRSFRTPRRFAGLVREIGRQVAELTSDVEGPLLGLGVTIPGLVDRPSGRVLSSPNAKMLEGRCVAEVLQDALGLPVEVVQCMHGLFLAERLFGRARELDDFVLINYVGGLGSAVCCSGKLLLGAHGLAGELGHIPISTDGPRCGCGHRGCLETLCTDRAIEDAVSERLEHPLEFDAIVERDGRQRLPIDDILNQAVEYLARGIATAINLYNPEVVFLYGRFLHLRPELIGRLERQLAQLTLPPLLQRCRVIAVSDRVQELERSGAVAAIIHRLTSGRRREPPPVRQPAAP